ncbi:uncharacterized protein LOC130310699 [Hyla sarda]|uniref:uncharacterized protein LOC130310699 n=1 Tax=Hyla sarda TaxID=327740 RepID=UPI0024C25E3E|nr:uncharacterized protein LOC130310699 [Hyla sarda]XP_056408394.1 uncharacterized protein LOC130310699 [Hyla sarda]XP_056408395.1 uncharacterized protein LOC130310699 [Hyla sarda]
MAMARKRGKMKNQMKLTAFFPVAEVSQDGAAASPQHLDGLTSPCGSASPATGSASLASSSSKATSDHYLSPVVSLKKQMGRSPSMAGSQQVHFSPKSPMLPRPGSHMGKDPVGYPNVPLNEHTMRGLLAELKSSLQGDLQNAVSTIQHEISSLGNRTSHIENKMTELTSSHKTVVDLANNLEDEVAALKLKIADMEYRYCHNNLRVRGVLESVNTEDLNGFLTDFFTLPLPQASSMDLLMDRVHRLPKPKSLPSVPRDVILRMCMDCFTVRQFPNGGSTAFLHLLCRCKIGIFCYPIDFYIWVLNWYLLMLNGLILHSSDPSFGGKQSDCMQMCFVFKRRILLQMKNILTCSMPMLSIKMGVCLLPYGIQWRLLYSMLK